MWLWSHLLNHLFIVGDLVCVCAGAPGIISSPYPGAAGFAPAIGFPQAGKLSVTFTLTTHLSNGDSVVRLTPAFRLNNWRYYGVITRATCETHL